MYATIIVLKFFSWCDIIFIHSPFIVIPAVVCSLFVVCSSHLYGIKKKQKQPPEVFCEKRCSQKFRKIHRKTPDECFWTPGECFWTPDECFWRNESYYKITFHIFVSCWMSKMVEWVIGELLPKQFVQRDWIIYSKAILGDYGMARHKLI